MVADKCCCLAEEYNLYPQRRALSAITSRPIVCVEYGNAAAAHEVRQPQLAQFTELCLALFEAGQPYRQPRQQVNAFPGTFCP